MINIIYDAGTGKTTYKQLTPEQIAQMEAIKVEQSQQPTIEERLTEIEQLTEEIIAKLNN